MALAAAAALCRSGGMLQRPQRQWESIPNRNILGSLAAAFVSPGTPGSRWAAAAAAGYNYDISIWLFLFFRACSFVLFLKTGGLRRRRRGAAVVVYYPPLPILHIYKILGA